MRTWVQRSTRTPDEGWRLHQLKRCDYKRGEETYLSNVNSVKSQVFTDNQLLFPVFQVFGAVIACATGNVDTIMEFLPDVYHHITIHWVDRSLNPMSNLIRFSWKRWSFLSCEWLPHLNNYHRLLFVSSCRTLRLKFTFRQIIATSFGYIK